MRLAHRLLPSQTIAQDLGPSEDWASFNVAIQKIANLTQYKPETIISLPEKI